MKTKILMMAGLAMLVGWSIPQHAVAQDGPGSRIVTVTTFDVPYQHRSTFLPFFRDRFLVNTQLNENVLNSRVMFHAWGSNGDQILVYTEYADMEGLAAGCGQPCADWNEANPGPEEGDEGYEEWMEGIESFQRFYSRHSDEIYSAPMGMAKLEGEVLGRIGPASDDEDD